MEIFDSANLQERPIIWLLIQFIYDFMTELEVIHLENITDPCHCGALWYLQHNCVGDTIVYH